MDNLQHHGLIHVRSDRYVSATCDALIVAIIDRGFRVFAHVDHSAAAADAGFHMLPTQLLIFGSPASGTPLMLAAPTLAIDLPMKALIWQAENGGVWITYNAPQYLQERHGLPEELTVKLSGVGPMIEQVARCAEP